MKGVVLAGGTGTRLRPMTKVVNKHVLPVYDKPMIFYPIQTLVDNGIDEILIVSTTDDVGRYIELVESESDFDAEFTYRVQQEPKGIAHALRLAENFADDSLAVILGDNIIFDDLSAAFEHFSTSENDAEIFLKEVESPARYGVAKTEEGEVVDLVEKPDEPESKTAIIGLYLYESGVFGIIRDLEPSDRGEYEITDVNREYLQRGTLGHSLIEGGWFDVGTPEGLFKASKFVREREQ